MEDREFAEGLLAVFDEGRRQRPRVAQFARQQRDAGLFVQRQIGHAGHRRVDQLGDRALMHGGILPHVEPRQMEAEAIHRPAQQPQPAARDHAGIVRDQRAIEHVEIGLELLTLVIGRGGADRRPRVSTSSFARSPRAAHRCRTPPDDTARRCDAARCRASARPAPADPARHRRDAPPSRVRRRAMQLVEIEAQHAAGLHLQRAAHDIRGDERVAVAVAADPASHPQERRQIAMRVVVAVVQPVLQRAMQPGHFAQEGVVVERQAVGDFVEHGQLGPAQQVGLPQRQHRAPQLLVAASFPPPSSSSARGDRAVRRFPFRDRS